MGRQPAFGPIALSHITAVPDPPVVKAISGANGLAVAVENSPILQGDLIREFVFWIVFPALDLLTKAFGVHHSIHDPFKGSIGGTGLNDFRGKGPHFDEAVIL